MLQPEARPVLASHYSEAEVEEARNSKTHFAQCARHGQTSLDRIMVVVMVIPRVLDSHRLQNGFPIQKEQ
jgi:hypothetical protein